MQDFRWSSTRETAALALAEGYTREEAAEQAGVNPSTVYRWLNHPQFAAEVDKLTLMAGVATKAERVRIAMKVIRGRTDLSSIPQSKADLLDWLKYVQSETDGIKLDLTAILTAASQVAGGGPNGATEAPKPAQLEDGG